MQDHTSISKIHGYLIDERNSGSLTKIPTMLYEEIHIELAAITNEARSMSDPFGENVQILLKERESLREYTRDLYTERTRKIFSLALAKATGEEINREELHAMVPEERSLYEIVSESATMCRKALLEGRQMLVASTTTNPLPTKIETETNVSIPDNEVVSFSDAHVEEVSWNNDKDAKNNHELYQVIIVQKKVEEFQDYSGRCYALSPGDIVSLPQPMAEILCKRNIALNIRLRK